MAEADDNLAITLTVKQLKAIVRESVREELGERASEPAKRYMDAADIATHFDVSRATVHNWIKHEGCPHKLRGKILRFEIAAVEAWFHGREPGLRRVK